MAIDHKNLYEDGAYPKCYKPYPPFYNICVGGNKFVDRCHSLRDIRLLTESEKIALFQCGDCIERNGFIFDYKE